MNSTFVVKTLGCKANQYESAAIAALLRGAGLRDATRGEPASLVVLHSCAVTAEANRKCRQTIRRLRRHHPRALLAVTGCYADDPDRRRLRSVDAVVYLGHGEDLAASLRRLAAIASQNQDRSPLRERTGNRGNDNINDASEGAGPDAMVTTFIKANQVDPVKENRAPRGADGLPALTAFPRRTRAIVKVQDGCDCFCSYCIVAHRRRRITSRGLDEILAEIAALVAAGHQEIVLCGIALGAYGRSTTRPGPEPSRLPELLDAAATAAGAARLRMSSLHPAEISDELLNIMARRPTICPHLHLPLQSGSDAVLKRMRRPYTSAEFLETVRRLRDRLEAPAVTTDVIVGFAGESDADFDATCRVAEQAGFSRMHVFPFSPREGTAAWAWRDQQPPPAVVRERIARLEKLERQLRLTYHRRFVGQTVETLVEQATDAGAAKGLSRRYAPVLLRCRQPRRLLGRVVTGRAIEADAERIVVEAND